MCETEMRVPLSNKVSAAKTSMPPPCACAAPAKARAKTVAVPTAAIELINVFISLSSLFIQTEPAPRAHVVPKDRFTGPADIC